MKIKGKRKELIEVEIYEGDALKLVAEESCKKMGLPFLTHIDKDGKLCAFNSDHYGPREVLKITLEDDLQTKENIKFVKSLQTIYKAMGINYN